MDFLANKAGEAIDLPSTTGAPEQVHVFSEDEILAVNAALAARRALLVRGEPGTGKTQLAKAAAVALHRAFISVAVDARTEARDLLWHFDAVRRLGEAQIQGALHGGGATAESVRTSLGLRQYIEPRALWWGFDWTSAAAQASTAGIVPPSLLKGTDPGRGVVVLIDEIDKAELDVPNGLLEALGNGEFTPQGLAAPVAISGIAPLVVVTTNEERALPDAFLRRCIVLHLRLPEERQPLIDHLVSRGTRHFPDLSRALQERAAELVVGDRIRAKEENWLPLPGQAEFIDLLRAVRNLSSDDAARAAMMDRISTFALRKHPAAAGRSAT
jgi:MoxR-like ATPase